MGATKRVRTAGRPAKSQDDASGKSNREELLRIAVDFFAENGFKGTSIRDIANALGVSVSVIYHYFGSKEGLWLAILEYSIKDIPERLGAVAARRDIEPLERFKLLVKTHLMMSARHQKESKIFLIEEARLSPEGLKINKNIQERVLDIYVEELAALKGAGLVKERHIKVLAFNVLGVINWYLRWYRPDGPLSADQIFEEVQSFLLHGALGPREPN